MPLSWNPLNDSMPDSWRVVIFIGMTVIVCALIVAHVFDRRHSRPATREDWERNKKGGTIAGATQVCIISQTNFTPRGDLSGGGGGDGNLYTVFVTTQDGDTVDLFVTELRTEAKDVAKIAARRMGVRCMDATMGAPVEMSL